MMSCLEIDPDKDVPEWAILTDNRDFKAIHSWDPIDRAVNDDLISESFLLDQKFLKLRSLAMRALATAVYISEDIHPSRIAASNVAAKNKSCEPNVPSTMNNIITQNISDSERASLLSPVLERLIDGLVQHQKEVVQDRVDFSVPNNSALGPDSPRLRLYARTLHIELLVTLLKFTLNVYKMVSTKDPIEQDGAKQLLETLSKDATTKFQNMVANVTEFVNTQGTRLFQRCEKLETIINVTESSSFAAILCGVCQVLLKSGNKFLNTSKGTPASSSNSPANSGKVSTNKGGKKKGGKNSSVTSVEIRKDLIDFYPTFNEMLNNFDSSISSLLLLVEDFEKVVALDQLSVLQTKFSKLKLCEINENQSGDLQNHCEKQTDIGCQNHEPADSSEMIETIKDKGNDEQHNKTLDAIQLDILKQMESSYGISFLQIKTVVQNKQNYFSFLKCDIGSNAQMNK